jgi:hypothetical protein
MRRPGVPPFPAWVASMGVDPERLYDRPELSRLTGFTVAEDIRFATDPMGRPPQWRFCRGRRIPVTAAQFPRRLVPAGETKAEKEKRRNSFTRAKNAKRKAMQLQSHAETGKPVAPVMTRFEAALRVLPVPTGKITIPEWARKVQRHRAWRDSAGKKLSLKTIEMRLRTMREDHPVEIGSEPRPPTRPGDMSGWLVWRRPSRKTP